MQRAYSLLHIKSVDAERRAFAGVATTPEPDRMGDVVEPKGVKFRNPLPLLLYHDKTKPVGHVTFHRPDPDGIRFEASMPVIDESGTLKERVDEAWQSVKAGLISGVSIGFRVLDDGMELLRSGGVRFTKTEVLELSLVTVPANASAVIDTIKSLDATVLAALGQHEPPITSQSPGVAGTVIHARKDAPIIMPKTIQEQIAGYEATRQTKNARMVEIMTKAGEDGSTLTPEQSQEYDTLETEVRALDQHLTRFRALEPAMQAAAVAPAGTSVKQASDSRAQMPVIQVKNTLPKGTAFTRYAMALAAGRGSRLEAAEYAKRWDDTTPEVSTVIRAAVTAGTTTDADWAAPLVVYQNIASEFVELLRPATIVGRVPGLRRVPFNVTMPTQTQGASANWVGQGLPKPVSELKFDQISLGMAKAAGIVVLSEELVRSSNPSAEAIVRQDLISTITQFLDAQFVNPLVAAVANVSPASITYGLSYVTGTGTAVANFRSDVRTLFGTFTAANISLPGCVWIMTETQALALSMMQNALGQPEFPTISVTGGTLYGLPVVASENIPIDQGSPEGYRIILAKASEILLADDGGVTLDVSREASLQMDSAPDEESGATTMVSLWQNNLVGLRAERFINWKRRRDAAVGYIQGGIYE
jgi:HK97 family phage major capsid protein/HK97 family phage prohead protease